MTAAVLFFDRLSRPSKKQAYLRLRKGRSLRKKPIRGVFRLQSPHSSPGGFAPGPFPAAAAAEPPRAGQRTAFYHRCPARSEKRGPGRRRHGTRPKRTTARAPERGPRPSLPPGRWGAPGQPITAPQAGTGQGRPRAARPTRGGRNAPNGHTAATGGTAKPHGGRPAEPPGPAPRTALSLAGGAAPPALRAAAKTDRGRPATTHGGPGPTPPGPDNHQPPGARARRGAARASRAIFMPPHSFWSRGRP